VVGLLNLMDLIDDGDEFVPGMKAIATPGHYPGHMSVIVSSDDEQAIVLADVAVHPAQISNRHLAYAFDVRPEQAAETRRRLFDRLRGTNCAVLCSHYPRGYRATCRRQRIALLGTSMRQRTRSNRHARARCIAIAPRSRQEPSRVAWAQQPPLSDWHRRASRASRSG
jgi:glyoxylase-like metal-dependent hydrolase (beta-lactamase superfamily II)